MRLMLLRLTWHLHAGTAPRHRYQGLIRRSGQLVQDRPSLVVGWGHTPELSTCIGRCPSGLATVLATVGTAPNLVIDGTVQGMARARSGQAPAWPLVSARSVRRGSRVKRDFACPFTWHHSPVPRWPACTVTLEAGGADTDTQRAITGADSSPLQSAC